MGTLLEYLSFLSHIINQKARQAQSSMFNQSGSIGGCLRCHLQMGHRLGSSLYLGQYTRRSSYSLHQRAPVVKHGQGSTCASTDIDHRACIRSCALWAMQRAQGKSQKRGEHMHSQWQDIHIFFVRNFFLMEKPSPLWSFKQWPKAEAMAVWLGTDRMKMIDSLTKITRDEQTQCSLCQHVLFISRIICLQSVTVKQRCLFFICSAQIALLGAV